MAGAIGWPASEVRAASLAELLACWVGHAKANGWLDKQGPAPMTRSELHELMERYPDGE
jgi:hypothetical protein